MTSIITWCSLRLCHVGLDQRKVISFVTYLTSVLFKNLRTLKIILLIVCQVKSDEVIKINYVKCLHNMREIRNWIKFKSVKIADDLANKELRYPQSKQKCF